MCRQCLSKYFANTKVNIIERKLSLNNVYVRYDNLYEVFSQKNSHTWIATNDCLSVLIKIYILHIRICEKNRYLTCALHAALRKISTYFSQRNVFIHVYIFGAKKMAEIEELLDVNPVPFYRFYLRG